MHRLRYYLRQTLNNINRSKKTVVQTLLMMTIALLLLGLFAWVSNQTNSILRRWEGDAPILLFLKDELPDKKRLSFVKELRARKDVAQVKLVTPSQAAQRLSKSIGLKALQGLQNVLLPTTIEVRLKKEFQQRSVIESLGKTLTKHPLIQQVDYSQEWYEPLWKVTRWLRTGFWVGGLLLLFAISLMVAGTIRLTLVLRQEEIAIMRLIGATEIFLRIPFYLEGLIVGIFSSLLALGLLGAVFVWGYQRFNASYQAFTAVPMQFLSPVDCLALLLGGAVAGLFGCWWAFVQSKGLQA